MFIQYPLNYPEVSPIFKVCLGRKWDIDYDYDEYEEYDDFEENDQSLGFSLYRQRQHQNAITLPELTNADMFEFQEKIKSTMKNSMDENKCFSPILDVTNQIKEDAEQLIQQRRIKAQNQDMKQQSSLAKAQCKWVKDIRKIIDKSNDDGYLTMDGIYEMFPGITYEDAKYIYDEGMMKEKKKKKNEGFSAFRLVKKIIMITWIIVKFSVTIFLIFQLLKLSVYIILGACVFLYTIATDPDFLFQTFKVLGNFSAGVLYLI